jgi:hypothetical protein
MDEPKLAWWVWERPKEKWERSEKNEAGHVDQSALGLAYISAHRSSTSHLARKN